MRPSCSLAQALDVHEHCPKGSTVTDADPAEVRHEVRAAATALLAGEAGVIQTARRILDLVEWSDLPGQSNDPVYRVISNIADQSDGLPVGSVRRLWAPQALAERDQVINRIETEDRRDLEVACRTLLSREGDI